MLENTFKRIKFLFLRKKINEELKKIVDELMDTCQKLEELEGDNFDKIVDFFNLTSKWYDRLDEIKRLVLLLSSVNYGQYTILILGFQNISSKFFDLGRTPDGINRTKKFQVVAKENIFFRNTTRSICDWEENKDTRDEKGMDYLCFYQNVGSFIDLHCGSIKRRIYEVVNENFNIHKVRIL